MMRTKKVVIIHPHLPHYRVKFFDLLRHELKSKNVNLKVVCGIHANSKFLPGKSDWVTFVPTLNVGKFIWHRAWGQFHDCDLVIAPQELKYLLVHVLHLKSRLGLFRFAFWGHGKNFQSESSDGLIEWIKQVLSTRVDWWFAYNDMSARIVKSMGFPAERITSVGNAIDTTGLANRRSKVSDSDLSKLRCDLGIDSDNVAIYTGALYSNKRIGFLIEAAIEIRERLPDFELIIIGNGPERDLIRNAAIKFKWVHDIGPKNDDEKVPYWALSKILLMPGLVGLVIVDSFALGVPIVTTDYPYHSPEIEYLNDGLNGVLIPCGDNPKLYASAVVSLLCDSAKLGALREGAMASAKIHNIENMVNNFTGGILKCIE